MRDEAFGAHAVLWTVIVNAHSHGFAGDVRPELAHALTTDSASVYCLQLLQHKAADCGRPNDSRCQAAVIAIQLMCYCRNTYSVRIVR